ncbi:MAG: hypothetical protein HKN32_08585, partial [Flavobacteriales bacterium]|nr:hypothetical protein [Flavobacteriales bacterium]
MRILSNLCLLFVLGSCAVNEHDQSVQSAESTSSDDMPWVDPMFFIEGQLCQHVRQLHEDSRGDLWIGTNVYGLMRYNGTELQRFEEDEELRTGRINSVVEDYNGDLWFATYSGLLHYNGKEFKRHNFPHDSLSPNVWSLLLEDDVLWLGTMDGIMQFNNDEFIAFPTPDLTVEDTLSRLSYKGITTLLRDVNGDLWYGTDGFGLCRFDGEKFTHFTISDGLPANSVTSLMQDNEGTLWIGTMDGGVSWYDGQEFTNLSQNGTIKGVEISGFFVDAQERVWFGVENNGVYCFDGNTWKNYYKEAQLPTNGINTILEDSKGRM